MRAFIAVEIPEEIRAEIAHISEILQRGGLIYGNFVSKDNMHLTLKFLGEVSEEKLNEIKDKLTNLLFPSFDATIEEMGFFPSLDYIKVIWVGLKSNNNELEKLAELVENFLAEVGIPRDERKFHSHLTFARVKGIKNKNLFTEKISEINLKPRTFKIDKIHLIKSELMREGPVYKKLASFNLLSYEK